MQIAIRRTPLAPALAGAFACAGLLALPGVGHLTALEFPAQTGAFPAPQPSTDASALKQASGAGIDVGAVVDTVRHHVAPVPGRPGTLRAEDARYRVDFAASGFNLTLRQKFRPTGAHRTLPPESTPFQHAPSFALAVRSARRGSSALPLAAGPWRAERNHAERTLLPGLSERVTSHESRLEWSFTLARPPPGSGDLRLQAQFRGSGRAHRLREGWRISAGQGRFVHLGALLVKDAHGRALFRALPAVGSRQLELRVPAS